MPPWDPRPLLPRPEEREDGAELRQRGLRGDGGGERLLEPPNKWGVGGKRGVHLAPRGQLLRGAANLSAGEVGGVLHAAQTPAL